MWDDDKIYNTAREAASRELRFIAIKEALLQMRNEDERELGKAQMRITELETENVRLAYLAAKSSDACGTFAKERNDARRRIAELEAQLAAALATTEQAAWCDVRSRENH